MSLTRKMLKAMSIEDEKIDQIIDAHTETLESIKRERDQFKAEAETLPEIQKQLEELKETNGNDEWQAKYEAIKAEYDSYKKDIEAKELKSNKEAAYKKLLKDVGISDKRIDSVLKVTDFDTIALDKDGQLKDIDKLKDKVKSDWSDFIVTTSTQGADVSTPPASTGGSTFDDMSLAEKMAFANDNPDNAEVKAWLNN